MRATKPTRVVLGALVVLACATSTWVPATGPLDGAAVGDEGVVEVVTTDPDGDLRETKIWILDLDGAVYIRTSGSRWLRNIRRDAEVLLRAAGTEYPARAVIVEETALQERVERGFREKYGFQDRVRAVGPVRFFETTVMRLDPR